MGSGLPIDPDFIFFSRFWPKRIDIGLGPGPLLNNIYHKKALQDKGYTAETFVTQCYHITRDFDLCIHEWLPCRLAGKKALARVAATLIAIVVSVTRYRCLYLYFDGGPLGVSGWFPQAWEPRLIKMAGLKTVLLAYGSDVQEMSRSPHLYFKTPSQSNIQNIVFFGIG